MVCGKGQLSSACKELQRLSDFMEQPVIGLAKEFEENDRSWAATSFALAEDSAVSNATDP